MPTDTERASAILAALLGDGVDADSLTPLAEGGAEQNPYVQQPVDPGVSSRMQMAMDHLTKPPGRVKRGATSFARGYFAARPGTKGSDMWFEGERHRADELDRHVKDLINMAQGLREQKDRDSVMKEKRDRWNTEARERELVDVGTELGIPELRGQTMPRAAIDKLRHKQIEGRPELMSPMDQEDRAYTRSKREREGIENTREDELWPFEKRKAAATASGAEASATANRSGDQVDAQVSQMERDLLHLLAGGKGPGTAEFDAIANQLKQFRTATGKVDRGAWDPQEGARFMAQRRQEKMARYAKPHSRLPAYSPEGSPQPANPKRAYQGQTYTVPAGPGQHPSVEKPASVVTPEEMQWLYAWVETEARQSLDFEQPSSQAGSAPSSFNFPALPPP